MQSIQKQKGSISVDTESLFPIIKKWLYSEHDIFLRELISNGHDAIKKLEKLAGLGIYKGSLETPLINIRINKESKTLTISDNGVGMTEEEINKYINQIAFSGAKEFLEKYKDENSQIIGHFGMGFFSSFMVSEKVEIETLSYLEGASSVFWSCDGSTTYEIGEGKRKIVGTDIILHLGEESLTYLDEAKIKELVKRYSNYLPVEIQVNGVKVNEGRAIWNSNASELKEDDYKNLFHQLFPYEMEPLFYLHFNIDYPFELKGIIYFPKTRMDFDPSKKGRIQLYCNNVFVSDNVIDIIPNHLNLLLGVIDSNDIPLNVSRSALQSDANVKKMGKYISNKVLEKLTSILEKDRKLYETYWSDLHTFVKFGCISDEDFYGKMSKAVLFRNSQNTLMTLDEYKKNNSSLGDKIIYASEPKRQAPYIREIEDKGIDVLLLENPLDNHLIQSMEYKEKNLRFLRVDSHPLDTLLSDKGEKDEDEKDKKEDVYKTFKEDIKKSIGNEEVEVKIEKLEGTKQFFRITVSEQLRRMMEMSKMMGNDFPMTGMNATILYVNEAHPMFQILKEKELSDKNDYKEICRWYYNLAKLQAGLLEGEELISFTQNLDQIIEERFKS